MTYLERASELRNLLEEYQRAYYTTGRSPVSDLEYDRLFDELSAIEKEHPDAVTEDSPTHRVGSDLSSDFPEVAHTIPVLSLDKAYSAQEVFTFIDRIHRSNGAASFVLEEKIDGFSIVLYYRKGILERAVTRGNGSVGNDVTPNVKTIKAVPLRLSKPVDISVRGEVFLPVEEFQRINLTLDEPYANPRNLAAGTIRRNKSSETARVPLSIFCYEGFWAEGGFDDHIKILSELKTLGFPVDPNLSYFCSSAEDAAARLAAAGLEGRACSYSDLPDEIEHHTRERKSLPYEIDGLVLKVNEIDFREELGYTEHHPRWAIAYKFEAPQAQSVVEAIDVQVGRTGRITPMARIKAAKLAGSVIRNVTLHNQDYIDSLELAVGDTVAVSKRGDVIPAVESVVEPNTSGNTTWKMPSVCPECGATLEKRGAHHFCPNRNCPAREKGRLEFFCAKKQMDIEGLGSGTIEDLYSRGYLRTITDIYTFDWSSLVRDGVPGYGEKKTSAIAKAVAESRKTPFRRVLAGLGMNEFSHKAIEILQNAGFRSKQSLTDLVADSAKALEVLTSLDGIGPLTGAEIVCGLTDPDNIALLNSLEELGLCMDDGAVSEAEPTEAQIFAGQSWCVTGTFDHFQPREKAMEEIKKRGGTEVSSVSRRTSCLLAGKNAGSKLAKAAELGVRVVSEEQFLAMIGQKEETEPVQGEAQEIQGSLF